MLRDSHIRLCKKKCRIKTPFGTFPCPWLLHAPEILNTRPELNDDYLLLDNSYSLEKKYDQSEAFLEFPPDDATKAIIQKLEVLKTSRQATKDDYPFLGYFYSLDKKYDLSEANYLTALELATDDATKAIIEQELKKIRDVMREPQLANETKQ